MTSLDDDSMDRSDVEIHDVPERSRYEARVPGLEVAGVAAYRLDGDTITFTHTEVPDELEGQGIASALARFALDDARRRGLAVIPRCAFMAAYIRRHAEYADLVPERVRRVIDVEATARDEPDEGRSAP
jgi:predicted GNAT family acetyltransferase